jgi:two-component system, chemotaxis family, protein-glutamate methylesterase/glutaminase
MAMATDPATAPRFGRVVIVASLGGLEVVTKVLTALAPTFSIPVAVVQHRSRTSDGRDSLSAILATKTQLPVRLAVAGDSADRPGITVLPAQTAVTIDESGRWRFADAEWDYGFGDALLMSSASSTRTVAVILTGALTDGAAGCRAIRHYGGHVLVQDPSTARAPSMPASAIATGCADEVLPPEQLAQALTALTATRGAA